MTNFYKDKYRFKRMRLQGWDYSWDGAYFVTIKVEGNIKCLGNIVDGKVQLSKVGDIVKQHWNNLPDFYPECKLDEFIIMS